MSVNLTGTFHVTRLAIPHMKQSAAGSIIIMSSLGGRFGYPNRSPYCVSKWGLIGFAKTLAIEPGGDNVRANAIAPGAVDGERMENVLAGRARAQGSSVDEARASVLAMQWLKRFVRPGGHRRALRLPRLGRRQVHLGAGDPDRQRRPLGVVAERSVRRILGSRAEVLRASIRVSRLRGW